FASAALANRIDELPLSHLRPAVDLLVLCDLVQLLPVAILQRVTGFAPAPAAAPRLFLQTPPRTLGKRGDRALLRRGALCRLDVLLGGSCLLCGRHREAPPQWLAGAALISPRTERRSRCSARSPSDTMPTGPSPP